jgi:hypothetical protein
MKSQISIALGRKDAINKQHMKMQVQIQFQCRVKALDQCHRTRMSLRYLEACLVDQVGPRRYVQIVRLTMANTLPRKREQNLRVKPSTIRKMALLSSCIGECFLSKLVKRSNHGLRFKEKALPFDT